MSDNASTREPNTPNDNAITGTKGRATSTPSSLLDNILSMHSPLMLHVIDEQGRITEVNRRWLEKMGYSLEQVLGRRIYEFFTPAYQEIVQQDLEIIRQSNE